MNSLLAMDVGSSHVACAVVERNAVLARVDPATEDPSSFFRALADIETARVKLVNAAFPPLDIHYAEPFVVPASVPAFVVRPLGGAPEGGISVVQAKVRQGALRASYPGASA